MDNALLRCPFCGGKGHVSEETKEESGTIMRGHVVWCGGCNCSTELYTEQYDAINAWNTRTSPDEITAALSRLAEYEAAEREGRLIKLPKCPKCGLINAAGYHRECHRCGALLRAEAEKGEGE